ncbi:MAG: hypothetical protein ABW321_21170 [Polyangiales bacterium]
MPWLVLGSAACASEAPTTTPDATFPTPTGAAGSGTSAPTAPSNTPSRPSGAGSAAPTTNTGTVTPPSTPSTPSVPAAGGAPAPSTPAAGGSAAPAGAAGAAAPAADGGAISADCQGFKLEGLMYSPGGSDLPNKCMPFHATTNNPYAVRCTDAWPWYKTKFPGDDFCILPPPPDKGVQYGVHPQGSKWYAQVSQGDLSGYDNLDDTWLMNSGEEESANYETAAPNMAESNFYRSYARMRPGSHHMIVNSDPAKPGNDTWVPVSEGGLIEGAAGLIGGAVGLPGAQRPDENRPPSLDKPMEDAGLFRVLPAQAKITFNMHHFNATSETILKEAWTNLWWESDARVVVHGLRGLEVGQVLTMSIPPGDTQDFHYSWAITQPVRLVEAFGHRHAWTSNFSAWVEEPDGKTDIVYQSFQWLDEPTYRYDSITVNPTPAPQQKTDGASSGVRMLNPGQKLHFNCHIEYTQQRAESEGAPMPQQIGALRFANEAFTGEMCILFGSTAAVEMPAPALDLAPLPDFATIR